MRTPDCPKIQVSDTEGRTLGIQFDHFDVDGTQWVETFKTILNFLGFQPKTIEELFNEDGDFANTTAQG